MTYMIFVYVFFVWLIAMIIWNIWTGKKEKEKAISKARMKNYDSPMKMSIGERLRRGERMKKREVMPGYFNGRYR